MKPKGKKDGMGLGGVIAYVVLAALTVLVLSSTINAQTLKAVRALNPVGILPTAAIWASGLLADAFALILLLRASGYRLSVREAAKNTFLRLYFNLITPFTSGGQPFAIYALSTAGIPAGSGSSAILAKTIIYSLISTVGACLGCFVAGPAVAKYPGFMAAMLASGAAGLAGVSLFFLSFRFPGPVIILSRGCFNVAQRVLGLFGKGLNARRKRLEFLAHCSLCRRDFSRYFKKGSDKALTATVLVAFQFLANLLILWTILRFLGCPIALSQGLALGSIVFFLMSYMPTPGSIGLGEALFVGVFALYAPLNILGLATIIWRVFNQYVNGLIGAAVTARYLRQAKVKSAQVLFPVRRDRETA